ncbi:hypothetical protein HELRODRAFT_169113 [Helobdella robusta]|uniref:Uncharacterized protein n=1 Tax=Helobdella robusta TaxID=6412 RepID=T1F1E9_HELRO|nr:hypothetical protein HELRODRAFT_169113 [Helobdella robusta]ESO08307.1 hypothetical protein HELRODRAFT_169113 [Helobdella robusta]
MWLVAKNSSLLSPDLTLIILHIALRNLRVLGSIGPRTSIYIGKNFIEGRAFPYFFIFPSAALAAAKPHSSLVRFTSHAKHLPALQGISVHPSGRLPPCAEMPDGSLRTRIEALEKSRQMAVCRALSNSPNLEGSMCLDVRRKYINLGKLRALRIIEFSVSSIGKGPEKTSLRCWGRRPSRPPEEPFLNDLTALSTSAGETQPAVGANAGKIRLSTGIFGYVSRSECCEGRVCGRVSGLITPAAAVRENMLYRISLNALSMVNVLENRNTSMNYCLFYGFCAKKDIHVLINFPGTKPELIH